LKDAHLGAHGLEKHSHGRLIRLARAEQQIAPGREPQWSSVIIFSRVGPQIDEQVAHEISSTLVNGGSRGHSAAQSRPACVSGQIWQGAHFPDKNAPINSGGKHPPRCSLDKTATGVFDGNLSTSVAKIFHIPSGHDRHAFVHAEWRSSKLFPVAQTRCTQIAARFRAARASRSPAKSRHAKRQRFTIAKNLVTLLSRCGRASRLLRRCSKKFQYSSGLARLRDADAPLAAGAHRTACSCEVDAGLS